MSLLLPPPRDGETNNSGNWDGQEPSNETIQLTGKERRKLSRFKPEEVARLCNVLGRLEHPEIDLESRPGKRLQGVREMVRLGTYTEDLHDGETVSLEGSLPDEVITSAEAIMATAAEADIQARIEAIKEKVDATRAQAERLADPDYQAAMVAEYALWRSERGLAPDPLDWSVHDHEMTRDPDGPTADGILLPAEYPEGNRIDND